MRIAVLALQGAFAEHRQKLAQLGVDSFEVRQLKDWEQPKDGLIIPGGESTTQAKLLNELGLMEPVKEAIAAGLPVYGTCAGLILLAKKIEGEPSHRIASMDITALRNAYGRQLGSFYIEAPMKGIEGNIPMTFIRAPYIKEVWGDAEVLAEVDGKIVAARQGNQLVTLTGSYNLAIYLGKNLGITPHLFNIWSTDESHRNIALNALHRSLNVETAQLATIGISQSRDIHGSNAMTWLTLYLLGKKNQTSTSTINRQACCNGLLHRFHQSEFIQEFCLGSTLATRNNQAILRLLPILQLAHLKTIHTQLSQLLSMLSKSTL